MTFAELETKWTNRREEWRALGVLVDGGKLAEDILQDIVALRKATALDPVSLNEANLVGGYSVDHLARLLSTGVIENVGRKHRPRIRRCDVPIKPGHVLQDSPSRVMSDRRRIVASVTTGGNEE